MLGNLNGWHLLILLAVILLLFGAARLPALAKSLGQSARLFRGEMKQLKAEDGDTPPPATGTQAQGYPGTGDATRRDPDTDDPRPTNTP
ncbi:twin-arginine translocase TatA/TatE family subunit [Microbacterium sp. JZ31]|uniref:twin-arginine translocase TatA/TatE family subunit n=1 Tax=Microbacterium sp. JZ31 TaxID=1906274 RepID=UPI0019312920|nr:twin-arginine translocase TatA/TatE family subunit [Microbacterium sp. JZ31]